MPHVPWPNTRALVDEQTLNIAGKTCKLKVYEQEYTRLWGLIGPFTGRKVVMKIPLDEGNYARTISDVRGEYYPGVKVSEEEQIHDIMQEARELIESGRTADRSCM